MYIYIYKDREERERERLNLVDLTFYVNFISIKYRNPLIVTFCLSFYPSHLCIFKSFICLFLL